MYPFMFSAGTSRENSVVSDQMQMFFSEYEENTQNSVLGAFGTEPQLAMRAANKRLKTCQ